MADHNEVVPKYVLTSLTPYYSVKVDQKQSKSIHCCAKCVPNVAKTQGVRCGAIHYGFCIPVGPPGQTPRVTVNRPRLALGPQMPGGPQLPGKFSVQKQIRVPDKRFPTSPDKPSPSSERIIPIQYKNHVITPEKPVLRASPDRISRSPDRNSITGSSQPSSPDSGVKLKFTINLPGRRSLSPDIPGSPTTPRTPGTPTSPISPTMPSRFNPSFQAKQHMFETKMPGTGGLLRREMPSDKASAKSIIESIVQRKIAEQERFPLRVSISEDRFPGFTRPGNQQAAARHTVSQYLIKKDQIEKRMAAEKETSMATMGLASTGGKVSEQYLRRKQAIERKIAELQHQPFRSDTSESESDNERTLEEKKKYRSQAKFSLIRSPEEVAEVKFPEPPPVVAKVAQEKTKASIPAVSPTSPEPVSAPCSKPSVPDKPAHIVKYVPADNKVRPKSPVEVSHPEMPEPEPVELHEAEIVSPVSPTLEKAEEFELEELIEEKPVVIEKPERPVVHVNEKPVVPEKPSSLVKPVPASAPAEVNFAVQAYLCVSNEAVVSALSEDYLSVFYMESVYTDYLSAIMCVYFVYLVCCIFNC